MLPTILMFVLGCANPGEESSALECSDSSDNDSDDLIDCLDPECLGYAFCYEDSAFPDDSSTPDDPPTDPGVDESAWPAAPSLLINEFMASNTVYLEDPDVPGSHPDWIEIYNTGSAEICLGGFFMTDDLTNIHKHALPDKLCLAAQGRVMLWADGDTTEGDDHLGFSLSREGGDLAIYDAKDQAVNLLSYDLQISDVSASRSSDAATDWVFDTTPTAGEANDI